MSNIKSQKDLIKNREWDCLIILDACRFDYFKESYRDYLVGDLCKADSGASTTNIWLRRMFKGKKYNDVVYVSANPRINSMGIEAVRGFVGSEIFYRVIDVWDKYWDEKLDTVPPNGVSRATKKARAKFPDKHLISHFMQPHYPYLSLGNVGVGLSGPRSRVKSKVSRSRGMREKVRKFLGDSLAKIFGLSRLADYGNKVKEILGISKKGYGNFRMVEKEYGLEGLRKAYEENLNAVLEEVESLEERLPGKLVVTSDHGEFLGERGKYGHFPNSDDSILREVPWFET